MLRLQAAFDLLAEDELWVGHQVAHLHEVAQAEVGDGVAVGLAGFAVGVEHLRPVVVAVFVQQVVQHLAILIAGVHPFAIEGNNGVGRITDQRHLVLVGPGTAADDGEVALRVAEVLLGEVWDHGDGVRKMRLEEAHQVLLVLDVPEGELTFVRHEERAGETTVLVGQAHHHEVAARPDVQAVRVHLRRAIGLGREGDLLVIVLDEALAEVEAALHHLLAHGAGRTIAAKDHIRRNGNVLPVQFIVETAGAGVEVYSGATVFEMQLHAGQFLRLVEHHAVQLATAHAVDGALIDAVRQAGQFAIAVVRHAGVHRNDDALHRLVHSGGLQGGPSPVAHHQVDAPARVRIGLARIGTTLVQVHCMPTLGEEHGQ